MGHSPTHLGREGTENVNEHEREKEGRKGGGEKGTEWRQGYEGGLGDLLTHHELLGPEVPRLQTHLPERFHSC